MFTTHLCNIIDIISVDPLKDALELTKNGTETQVYTTTTTNNNNINNNNNNNRSATQTGSAAVDPSSILFPAHAYLHTHRTRKWK